MHDAYHLNPNGDQNLNLTLWDHDDPDDAHQLGFLPISRSKRLTTVIASKGITPLIVTVMIPVMNLHYEETRFQFGDSWNLSKSLPTIQINPTNIIQIILHLNQINSTVFTHLVNISM